MKRLTTTEIEELAHKCPWCGLLGVHANIKKSGKALCGHAFEEQMHPNDGPEGWCWFQFVEALRASERKICKLERGA